MAQKLQIIEVEDNLGRMHRLVVRPVSQHTTQTKTGPVLTPTMPAWVTQARDFKNWQTALKLIIRDMISAFDDIQADRVRAYCAPLRVSDTVHEGFFWLDAQGCITVNEVWAKDRALDSDGDNAFLIYTEDRQAAYFVKYPLTQPVVKLYLQSEKAADTWKDYDATLERWDRPVLTEEQIRDGFLKSHRQAEIGIKTNKWDALALHQAKQARMSYFQTCRHLLADPRRFYDLEGDLKASRAGLGARTFTMHHDIEEVTWVVTDEGRWRLQLKPGTVDYAELKRLVTTDWAQQSKWEETLKGLEFKQAGTRRGTVEEEPEPTYNQREKDKIDPKNGKLLRKGRNFTERLEHLGTIQWEELPHKDPSLPPAMILRVFHRKYRNAVGTPVALHDGRRGGSMHYQYYLPPVAIIRDSQVLWVSARDMLEGEIAGIKTDVEGMKWPQSLGSIEAWPAKANQLQQALQKFVGKYGIPTIESNEFRTMGEFVAVRTFTVMYGTIDPEEMWNLVQGLRRWFADHSNYAPGILGGDKGSQHPWRKYMIADPRTLVPVISALGSEAQESLNRCSAKRVGEIRTQLAGSIPLGMISPNWQQRKAKVFIYGDGTRGQLYAFPSGQKLQDIPGVFLPQVNDRPDEDRGINTARKYMTLSGDQRVSYVSDARPTIGCGKLIHPSGMKNFCGVETEQLYAFIPGQGNVPVDFAISQYELMSAEVVDDEGRVWKGKQCLEAMLEQGHGRDVTVQWHGTSVRGKLVEIPLFRTTTASENTRPETRVRKISGVAKHAVRAAMMESLEYGDIDTPNWLNWDNRSLAVVDEPRLKPRRLEYLLALQAAAQVIGSNLGLCDAPRHTNLSETLLAGIEMENAKS